MKESISNSLILGIVITFVTLIILFFATSLSYTKAFKVKNRIVSIVEKYGGYNNDAKNEIEANLAEIGYRVNNGEACTTRFPNAVVLTDPANSNYRYCIQEYDAGERGKYYGVTAYMYFELPLVGRALEFPVYGETKTMGLVGWYLKEEYYERNCIK